MEPSTTTLGDAGKAVDGGNKMSNTRAEHADEQGADHDTETYQKSDDGRKRKGNFGASNSRQQHGSRGGGRNDDKRHKKGNMGRGDYFRDGPDKRQKTHDSRQKHDEAGTSSTYGIAYSKEEISAEQRRPKRKVAVLIGYSGTGYKGMQITPTERTIEGDLFQAFIKAGAISKANADDPKKAGLVRCARTDKGVHAAGNMISLKLIVEDDDIVDKINAELSGQIRIWGIERTIGSFSCYQACDSRWYEYLIPSHAFLPPHPSSWLAKKTEEVADEVKDRSGYEERQAEVKGFWEDVDQGEVKRMLDGIDEDIRWEVVKALQGGDEAAAKVLPADADVDGSVRAGKSVGGGDDVQDGGDEKTEEQPRSCVDVSAQPADDADTSGAAKSSAHLAQEDENGSSMGAMVDSVISPPANGNISDPGEKAADRAVLAEGNVATTTPSQDSTMADGLPQHGKPSDPRPVTHSTLSPAELDRLARLRAATRDLRQAYLTAKRRYRIPSQRIAQIQSALSKFVGTRNFHNYTVSKTHRDPSAKRHIKSFVVDEKPILIGEGLEDADKSEWLSLKIHGQSFMMHQIRKMVGMVALLVRSGADLSTITSSFGPEKFSIPKVPGLGLLLERPVFDSYNEHQAAKFEKEKLDFGKFEKEIASFKEKEIYQRIFREEEERNEFGRFFNHVDNFKEAHFLYVTSKGLEACREAGANAGSGAGKGKGKNGVKAVSYESDGEGQDGDEG
ncbi:tRNA pseudouridine synthase 1 [Friedmanniomyces endolithicus]|uniref:tRNA pseudouridine synthase 1 n=1 Tax=Friedmanniomyces endolithicus TaxID=329885 RepID=A0AAN6KKF5_9PEZI|nr:tRNA pseudouridine synthase 1 [Friedmanniomyces endolithicus]KAK0279547.1 tRNA pseudouridine synthase 1 [Friedmanniomyces endolithicus]KAK0920101.1 tRNA pseudouridine synthase 1 [Friedmanniomyces endolithicus]KAK0963762.1 tRNA pseudouridine synthase 1 [Friedmanniomyces endolithicus]KAK0988384.1 tRNA pseudouridine synthase 1 [Friedmanniomyces endolithicus]